MKPNFKHCLVITNANGTSIQRAMNLAGQLGDYFPPEKIEIIEISKLSYEATEALIRKKAYLLGPQSLVCIAGGDGTINCIVNILLTTRGLSAEARQSVILPLWGGNGNDLAIILNGFVQKTTLHTILSKGYIVPIHPIAIRQQRQQEKSLKLACSYASFGVIAAISRKINHQDYRHQRVYNHVLTRSVIEAGIALHLFLSASSFTVEIEGTQTQLYDFVVINGPRMAKRDRFPLKITDKKFIEASIGHKLSGLFFYILHAMNWRSTRPAKTERTLIVHDSIYMQIDGEVTKIPEHTSIDIRLYDRPVYALSTKLAR